MGSIAAAAKLITWAALQRQQNCDRGEDNKGPDWLIDQSIARQVARGVLQVYNAEKVDGIVAAIVMKSRIKIYFL